MCHFARFTALTYWISIRFMAGIWVENGLDVAGGSDRGGHLKTKMPKVNHFSSGTQMSTNPKLTL